MINEWSVLVEGPGEASDENLAAFAEHLHYWHGVAAAREPDRIAGRLTLDVFTSDAAAVAAVGIVHGWIPEPDTVEVVAADRLDGRDHGPRAELVGVAEVAIMLGVSRQRVSDLAGRLPTPRARLASGPVWDRHDVAKWAEGWDRKPGRPRRARKDG